MKKQGIYRRPTNRLQGTSYFKFPCDPLILYKHNISPNLLMTTTSRFLGALAKLIEATVSLVMSPSFRPHEKLGSQWKDFHEN
jgi:hypothetical protein